jgi:hypothetical protein
MVAMRCWQGAIRRSLPIASTMTISAMEPTREVAAWSLDVMRIVPAGLSRSSLIAACSASTSSSRGPALVGERRLRHAELRSGLSRR